MVISDKFQFIFVHIPKNAGSFVRKKLEYYQENDIFNKVVKHQILGNIDVDHVTLENLEQYYPELFLKVNMYWSFAILRDPYSRFGSSVTQRIKMYNPENINTLSQSEFHSSVLKVINEIKKCSLNNRNLPFDLIHFQPQHSYIFLNNRQIVKNIYTTKQFVDLTKEFMNRFGIKIDFDEKGKENVGLIAPNKKIGKLYLLFKPIYDFFPNSIRLFLKNIFLVDRNKRFDKILSSPEVIQFINTYYAKDIELFNIVTENS